MVRFLAKLSIQAKEEVPWFDKRLFDSRASDNGRINNVIYYCSYEEKLFFNIIVYYTIARIAQKANGDGEILLTSIMNKPSLYIHPN